MTRENLRIIVRHHPTINDSRILGKRIYHPCLYGNKVLTTRSHWTIWILRNRPSSSLKIITGGIKSDRAVMVGSGRSLETPYLEDRVIRRKCGEEYLARTISGGRARLSVLIKPELPALPISLIPLAAPPLKGVRFNLLSPIPSNLLRPAVNFLVAPDWISRDRLSCSRDQISRQREDDR